MTAEASALPDAIREAFRGHLSLPLPRVAELLEMDPGTLREHVRAGHVVARSKGLGRRRPRLVFTLVDVATLWAHMRQDNPPPIPLPRRRGRARA